MPDDLLKSSGLNPAVHSIRDILLYLLLALALGYVVAWIYRHTRKDSDITRSFPGTLIFLCLLIAMVTQVIGENLARAFGLVGALSIVRFRTVVRDTQDTAYVIFAVVVGMAVGAHYIWVAVIGIGVFALAAFVLVHRPQAIAEAEPTYLLSLRIGIGHDFEKLLGPVLANYIQSREVFSIGTAKQGVSLDVAYKTRLLSGASPDELVKDLNRVEGIQSVQFERREFDVI